MSARYNHSSRVHEGLFSGRTQEAFSARSQRDPTFTPAQNPHVHLHQSAHSHLFDRKEPSREGSARPVFGYVSARDDNNSNNNNINRSNDESSSSKYNSPGEADPLQLEHMIGYSGEFRKSLLALPHDEQLFIKSMGSLVSVENINDPHSQRFLRGHDMPVCAIAVSPSGRLIASGQQGTKNYKGNASPIFLWNSHTLQRLGVLRGLAGGVSMLAFSTDEKFICGCGEDSLLYIWDLSTGEVVFGQRQTSCVTVMKWVEHRKDSHNTAYELVFGTSSPNNALLQGQLTYDSMRMQWSLKTRIYTTPPTGGLVRSFTCVDLSADKIFVYVGTSSGDVLVYRRDTVVFRAGIPVCTNGVQDLLTLPDESVVAGGGDGSLVRIVGRDMVWQKTQEFRLDSMVRSITLLGSPDMNELLVACASGALYRASAYDLQHRVVSVSTTSPITCLAFPPAPYPAPPDVFFFASGSVSGEIRVWDLTDYACVSALKVPKAGAVLCLAMMDGDHVLSGWQDGSVRCSDSNGKQLWQLPTAHRDGAKTIAVHADAALQYLVTGGGDGAIRVWKYSNRELVTQYTEHRQGLGVAKVLVDVASPRLVHSVGGDGSVLSYDLQAGRRVVCHLVTNGSMASMSQRRDAQSERELVTCDSLGRLLFWDMDIRDPVLAVQDPTRAAIRCVAVSPSGRFVAYAGDDQLLKVLDVRSQQVLSVGQSHSAPVLSLCWTPDERQIVTGAEDACLCVWNFFLGGE